jgi:hypothetical protein
MGLIADGGQGLLGKGAHRGLVVDDQDGWWQHGLYIGVFWLQEHRLVLGGGEASWRPADNTVAMKPWWLLPLGRVHPLWWILIAGPLVGLDYLTGPKPEFPVLFTIPVTLAAWYSGRGPAVTLAIVLPLAHAVFAAAFWNSSASFNVLAATTLMRSAAVIAVALWLARLSDHERELRRQVQTLEGLLSICAFCKRIRDPSGNWERLESYIAKRSQAQFSHSFCADCWKTHYAELGEPPPE